MRILLATPYDLSVPGGANRQPLGLLDPLTREGFEVRLAGPCSGPVPGDDPRIVPLGPVTRIPLNGAASPVSLDPRMVSALRRLLADFPPDVVHVQEPVVPLPSAALLWLAPSRARKIGTFHTYSETSRGYLYAWPWVRAVWSRLDLRVAVSEAAREFATRYHAAEFHIVPNALDLPAPDLPLRPVPTPEGPLRILFVGRMDEPRKGFSILLGALARVEAAHPGTLRLVAVGRGREAHTARVEAERLPVEFAGELDEAGLATEYRRAELAVVPSLGGESFGLVALEAMAHGTPVVATSILGYRAWMEGTARLVPPGDEAALAGVLEELAADRKAREAMAARGATLASQYSWPRIAATWIGIYRGLLPPHRSKTEGSG